MKIAWLIFCLCAPLLATPIVQEKPSSAQFEFEVHNPARRHSKVKCLFMVIGTHKHLTQLAKLIQFDLEFSDQLELDIKRNDTELDQAILAKLFTKQDVSLCLYLEEVKDNPKKQHVTVKAVLKEPFSGATMFEKQYHLPENALIHHAHRISDELMPTLTGQKGPMLSTLAYCKQISPRHKVVCVSDYACRLEKIVVPAATINVAPCWHSHAPVLFYSQFTRSNSRLMSLDLNAKTNKIICSYDGLNMQPSFSPDGSKAVLCLSGRGNSELYFYDQGICNKLKRRVFQQMTNNKGNNVSPCYLPNGDVVFCSDYQSGFPQIYYMDHKTKTTRRLTNGRGYCAAPAHCAANNGIVYTRYVHGVFQLFTIDLSASTPRERQLTFTAGDKVEPTWSECGKYVAFTYNYLDTAIKKKANQIAVLNIPSGKIRVLTTSKEPKSFPAWTNRSLYQA